MPLRLKSSRTGASDTVRVFPDLPKMPSQLLSTSGAHEWNSELQGFWDTVRERLWDGSLDTKRRVVRLSSELGQLSATIETLSETAVTGSELSAAMTTTLSLASSDAQARVTTEAGIRASADSSLSGNIGAIHARWGVSIDVNGNVVGRIRLDGSGSTSEFSVLASSFKVWDGVSTSFQVFTGSGGHVQIGGLNIMGGGLSAGSGSTSISIDSANGRITTGVNNNTSDRSTIASNGFFTRNGAGSLSGTWGNLNALGTLALGTWTSNPSGDVFSYADVITLNGATGTGYFYGSVTASSFIGSGASLTSLNASNISSGILSSSRMPSSFGGTFLGYINSELLKTTGTSVDSIDCNIRVLVGGNPVIVLNKDLPGVTINGNKVVGTRYGSTPTDVASLVACLQHHGLCP